MDTFIGMTYEQWAKVQQPKSDARRLSDHEAWRRDALQGMFGREVAVDPPLAEGYGEG